ncbi:MAG TPA: hypothetical protein HPP97_06920 [Desulfuromonadales bacterium]|nr:hypothetical protein [Desulfuromonadales bacterium]
MTNKIKHGQFFTTHNPFYHPEFQRWLTNSVKLTPADIILEPFAGSNNLVKMLQDTGITNSFQSYDIDPQADNIVQRDTIAHFPAGHRVAITNPPYISKSSSTKKGFQIGMEEYTDLYQLALSRCIDNCEYTAAIVPLSFVNSGHFRECLQTVISLPVKMFRDTDCPVCLAMFHNWSMCEDDPTPYEGFLFWIGEVSLGIYSELQLEHYTPEPIKMRFKVPTGRIGLFALDDTKSATIRFCQGEEIPASKVKPSGNCITRIDIEVDDVDDIVSRANKILNRHRQSSGDAGFIIYRQSRDDGTTRRRLGFELARQILNMAVAGWGE